MAVRRKGIVVARSMRPSRALPTPSRTIATERWVCDRCRSYHLHATVPSGSHLRNRVSSARSDLSMGFSSIAWRTRSRNPSVPAARAHSRPYSSLHPQEGAGDAWEPADDPKFFVPLDLPPKPSSQYADRHTLPRHYSDPRTSASEGSSQRFKPLPPLHPHMARLRRILEREAVLRSQTIDLCSFK